MALSALAGLSLAGVILVTSTDSAAADSHFFAGFDGQPAQPASVTSINTPGWDISYHDRGRMTEGAASSFRRPESVDGQHGPNCEGPPATHVVATFEDSAYRCRDHMMTAINSTGYGVLYLTPAATVDFSDEATISWDMSTQRVSKRDWVDLWITPYDQSLQAPLEPSLPDLNGDPANAIHIRMDSFNGGTLWDVYVIRNHHRTKLERNHTTWDEFLTPDPARRDTLELTISRNHISFGMPDYGHYWFDGAISDLGWDAGVVQWGHHSYNPWKDGNGGPQTWHWDNFSISPAVPFTMIPATTRAVDDDTASAVTFPSSAPKNAHLRFMGVGALEVSFNGGQSWQRAQEQRNLQKRQAENFRSYWMPIPEGTSSVRFRGGPDSYQKDWQARNISIWSHTSSGSVPVATPTATPTPKPSATATPSTTATPSATVKPTPPVVVKPPSGGGGIPATPTPVAGSTDSVALAGGKATALTYFGPPLPVEEVLGNLASDVKRVGRFNATSGEYDFYYPTNPGAGDLSQVNTFDALVIEMRGPGTWVTPAAPASQTTRPVPLKQGVNAIGYTGASGKRLADVLAPVMDRVRGAWIYDTSTGTWRGFTPRHPQSTPVVDHREVIYIMMSSAATLTMPVEGD